MKIKILSGIKGAQEAKGITVIIDVLRAATVASYLLDSGIQSIIPVSSAEEAFNYKKVDPEIILVGEDKGIKIPGFDIGNSPLEIKKNKNLKNKRAIHRSSTGTQGIVNSHKSSVIIFGSFVSSTAIKEYILKKDPEDVSLVSMEGFEDDLFAEFLKQELLGKLKLSMSEIITKLENHPGCDWFLNPNKPLFPIEDFYLSLELDKFNFFPIVKNNKIIKRNC